MTKGRTHLIILLAIYFSLAYLTFAVWQKNHRFSVNGDEPHYLVMASGIVKHGTLEQTDPYKEEFQTREIFDPGFAPRDAFPDPGLVHVVRGPHGLFNVHNLGLPLLLAVPFFLGGTVGAKLFMIFLSGMVLVTAWNISGVFSADPTIRFAATGVATIGLPLIPASNQIYPDILAGLIVLNGLYWLLTFDRDRSWRSKLFLACTIAYLPWLQVKFAATSAIFVFGLFYKEYTQPSTAKREVDSIGAVWNDRRWNVFGQRNAGRYAILLMPIILSALGLAAYNYYAFGQFTGPYQGGAFEFSQTALMVFLGLHIDQNHGFLLQNPVQLIGVFSVPILFAVNRFVASIWLIAFLSLTVPNALHPNWYGGYSFSGRFAWASALTFLVPTILGLTRLAFKHASLFRVFVGISIVIQLILYCRYTFSEIDLHNKLPGVFLHDYSVFYYHLENWLPALYNLNWAFRYAPNWIWGLLVVAVFVLGSWVSIRSVSYSNRAIYSVCCFAVTILCFGVVSGKKAPQIASFTAAGLPSMTGRMDGSARVAVENVDKPGHITFGPYIFLSKGSYKVISRYRSSAPDGQSVGSWDVFCDGGRTMTVEKGSLNGTSGQLRSVTTIFDVPDELPSRYQFRNFWNGSADLQIVDIEFQQL